MAKQTATLSDVQETEWTHSFGTIFVGLGIIAGSALLLYFTRYWLEDRPLLMAHVLIVGAILVGTGITALGVSRFLKARSTASFPYPCPYCAAECRLSQKPTEDFVCDGCSRTVHFYDGEPVQVVEVTCAACRAEHKVAVTSVRYLCDRCNRPVTLPFLVPDSGSRSFETDGLLRNYDVLLTGYDHRKENDLAFKLQNLMVVNLPEAKRLMHSVSGDEPLIIGYSLPERKADSVRRQLQEVGAVVSTRVTASTGRPV